ncbi:MAG: vitamin B12 dependent-methionine synthase activation domain-containing protein, partial [Phycisphaerae bacterium]
EHDLRAIYHGPLAYAKDAFEGLDLMKKIAAGESIVEAPRQPAPPIVKRDAIEAPPRETPARSSVAIDNPVPTPPYWGARVVEQVHLKSVMGYLNETMLFQVQWQYKKQGRNAEDYEAYLRKEVRPILHQLAERCGREKILQPQAVYGYWPCNSEGDDLIVFEPPTDGAPASRRELARFTFPRQDKPPYWCLSDFWRPIETGEFDVAAFTIVTVGRRASDVAREWFEQNLYRDYLHLHGLGVETAEALAEYLHKQVRMELGIAGRDARDVRRLFKQGYQGSRYSFGYPACPNLEDQVKLWPLLEPGRIGITLS